MEWGLESRVQASDLGFWLRALGLRIPCEPQGLSLWLMDEGGCGGIV